MLATIGVCHVQQANHDQINLHASGEDSSLHAKRLDLSVHMLCSVDCSNCSCRYENTHNFTEFIAIIGEKTNNNALTG